MFALIIPLEAGGTPSHPIATPPPGVWPSPPVHVGGGPMPGHPPGLWPSPPPLGIWGGAPPAHVGGGPMPGTPPGIWGGGAPPHVSTGPIVPAPGPGLPSHPIYVPPSIWPTPPAPPSQGDHVLLWWPGVGWIWVPAPGGIATAPDQPPQPKS